MVIQVASYDIWRTLLKASKEYNTERARLIGEHLGWNGDLDTVVEAVRASSKQLDKLMDDTGEQFGFAPRVQLTASSLGLYAPSIEQIEVLEAEVNAAHLAMPPSLMEASLPEVFARHKDEGRRIAVISNTGMTSGKILRDLLDVTGLLRYVDYELYSDELGIAKPDERVFVSLMTRANVFASEILHVGDNAVADVRGAKRAGCYALLYDPKSEICGTAIAHHEDVFIHTIVRRVRDAAEV